MIPLLPIIAEVVPSLLLAVYNFGHRHGHRAAIALWRDAGAERRRRAEQATEEAWWVGGRFKTGDGVGRN